MKKIGYYILLLSLFSLGGFTQRASIKPIKIGLMINGLKDSESEAIVEFIVDKYNFEGFEIDDATLVKGQLDNLNLSHIWIHQLFDNHEIYKSTRVGDTLKKFVMNGGNLILSLDAVRLLNDWGIEKNILEIRTDSIKDDGFGRPLGFHSFKSHPIFDGLHGGTFPWKSKKDHVVRKIGFFDNQLPDSSIAKVIGIEWTYITFHENNKLVLEYQLGKGKIIVIGAFSYFAKENYNNYELKHFYTNIFEYMHGINKDIESNYWEYTPPQVTLLDQKFEEINISHSSNWNLPELSISIKKQEATDDITILSGRRMSITGNEKGGIEEIWINPFMSFRDIETGILFKKSDTVLWLNHLTPSITISPELLIREYKIGTTNIKEITTVSIDKPVGIIHYEYQGNDIAQIVLKYKSNFRYMWPYSEKITSSIFYKWEPKINAVVSTSLKNDLVNIMSFSSKPKTFLLGQYEGFTFENGKYIASKTDLTQVSGIFSFDANDTKGKFSVYIVGGDKGIEKTINMFKSETRNFNNLFLKSSDYYSKLLSNSLMLSTPDNEFNTGYKWALVRTDQFFQETPDIGTTLVAGLGSTSRGWDGGQKISGRPGYAWYFGRDAQWSAFAVNTYGGHKMVKKILKVFTKYQSLNGKIFHELTTSGVVHYDASDSTPLYIVLAAHYLKYSGDIDYITEIWPSLKKAMNYCYSTDTDNDGLIEITNVGHGWIEGGPLFGTHTEVYLAGLWAAALDAASYITENLNLTDLSISFQKDATKVKEIIDKEFWNKEGQYFYNGKFIDGTYMHEKTVLSGVPIYFDAVTDAVKAFKTAASFSSNSYSTDWGVRILPDSSKSYNPNSYHSGMVWPLFTGWASLAEYKTGNYVSGFSHVMNNLLMYHHWNKGSVEETLHGEIFKPAGVSSQQSWSETMVLQPITEGMLGIFPDALSNRIALNPHFPWHWKYVKVDNIIFGNHKIEFEMSRTSTSTIFKLNEALEKGSILNMSLSFPLGTVVDQVFINGKVVKKIVKKNAESIDLFFEEFKLNEQATVEIFHNKGIGAIPLVNRPNSGDFSKEAKIIHQELLENKFEIVIEGLANKQYQFKVMSNVIIDKISNGRVISKEENIYTIETNIPASNQKYMKQHVSIKLKE